MGARTTHFQRTIGTLQGVLSGLCPEAADSGVSVPAVTAGDGNEIMYGNATACAALGTLNASRLSNLKGAVSCIWQYLRVRSGLLCAGARGGDVGANLRGGQHTACNAIVGRYAFPV